MLAVFSALGAALRRRWPEIAADLAWIAGSWLRPGDSESGWEQGRG